MSNLPGDYLNKPYGILKKYTIGGATYIGEYADAVNTNLAAIEVSFDNTFNKVLLAAASNERAKEWSYINQLYEKLFSDGYEPTIYADVRRMLDSIRTPGIGVSEAWVSQLIDTLQKLQFGLYDFDKSLAENMNIMKGFNEATLSKPYINAINEVLGAVKQGNKFIYTNTNNILQMSAQTILENISIKIKENINKGLADKKVNYNDFTVKQKEIITKLQQQYITKIQQFYSNKFKAIEGLNLMETNLQELEKRVTNYDVTAKSKDKINANDKPIQQFLHEFLFGVLGGQALEMTIEIGGGGANTGKIVGNSGRSIDADNMLLGTATLEFFPPDLDDLTKQLNNTQKNIKFDDLKNQINKNQELLNGLAIMTSAKDQSTNKSFNSYTATNTKVKLKDPGSLKARRGEIEDMFAAANCGGVENLIFALANLAKDFVYEGKIEMAKRNLGTICVAWMFDDAVEIIQDGSMFKSGLNISTLHFYNINNYLYTLSDILFKTAQNIDSGIGKTGRNMKYVNVSISGTNIQPFNTLLSTYNELQGIERWDYVSNELMTNITISVQMNVKNLFKDLFKF